MNSKTGMSDLMRDVADFHRICDAHTASRPKIPDDGLIALRERLIEEEFDELMDAMLEDDLAQIGKESADLIYVIVGLNLTYGIPLDQIWDAVHASNMAKADPVTGKVLKREDGKVLKGPDWVPPDIEKIIEDACDTQVAA